MLWPSAGCSRKKRSGTTCRRTRRQRVAARQRRSPRARAEGRETEARAGEAFCVFSFRVAQCGHGRDTLRLCDGRCPPRGSWRRSTVFCETRECAIRKKGSLYGRDPHAAAAATWDLDVGCAVHRPIRFARRLTFRFLPPRARRSGCGQPDASDVTRMSLVLYAHTGPRECATQACKVGEA